MPRAVEPKDEEEDEEEDEDEEEEEEEEATACDTYARHGCRYFCCQVCLFNSNITDIILSDNYHLTTTAASPSRMWTIVSPGTFTLRMRTVRGFPTRRQYSV
jgi:hypothetical protein